MLVYVCTSMWIKKCLAAMLAVKRLTSVTSEVNLRNPLHSSEEADTRGIYSGFEIQSRRHQKSKTGLRGISGPTKRTDVLQIYFVKESSVLKAHLAGTMRSSSTLPAMMPVSPTNATAAALRFLASSNGLVA